MIAQIIIEGRPTVKDPQISWLLSSTNEKLNKEFFINVNFSFCFVFDDFEDIKENFYVFFHKEYFTYSNQFILFIKTNISKSVEEKVNDLFALHGYEIPIIFEAPKEKFEKGEFLILNNVYDKYSVDKINLADLLKQNTFYFSTYNDYLLLKNKYNKTIEKSEELKAIANILVNTHLENIRLKNTLEWNQKQLQNYKTYLFVLKKLIREGSDFGSKVYNNRVINFLKKIGPLRKAGKYMYKKLKSK